MYDPYYYTYSRVTSWFKETVEVETREINSLYDSSHPTIWFFGDFVIQLNFFHAHRRIYAQVPPWNSENSEPFDPKNSSPVHAKNLTRTC